MTISNKLIASTIAAAAAFSIGTAFAADTGTVGSSDVQQIENWYGRAGGLTDSDRVSGLATSRKPIGVSWDQDVAARTNMSTDRGATATVGVSYDEDVAARTNMGRSVSGPVKAAGVEGAKTN